MAKAKVKAAVQAEAPVLTAEEQMVEDFKALTPDKQLRAFNKTRSTFHEIVHVTYKQTLDQALLPSLMEEAIVARNRYEALVKATGKHRDVLKKMDRNLANIDRGAAYLKKEKTVAVVAETVAPAPAATSKKKAKKGAAPEATQELTYEEKLAANE